MNKKERLRITEIEIKKRGVYILLGIFVVVILISLAFYIGHTLPLFYPENNKAIIIYDENLVCVNYIQRLEKCYTDMTEMVNYQNYLVEKLSNCNWKAINWR